MELTRLGFFLLNVLAYLASNQPHPGFHGPSQPFLSCLPPRGDLTFFKNLQSNSLPTGKSFQSIATKFPHPGLHIAVHPKAGPKKGTIKISPNKTLQSFKNFASSPRIHIPVTATIIRFNHNPCYTAKNT